MTAMALFAAAFQRYRRVDYRPAPHRRLRGSALPRPPVVFAHRSSYPALP